jgi:hypothetical protein
MLLVSEPGLAGFLYSKRSICDIVSLKVGVRLHSRTANKR